MARQAQSERMQPYGRISSDLFVAGNHFLFIGFPKMHICGARSLRFAAAWRSVPSSSPGKTGMGTGFAMILLTTQAPGFWPSAPPRPPISMLRGSCIFQFLAFGGQGSANIEIGAGWWAAAQFGDGPTVGRPIRQRQDY